MLWRSRAAAESKPKPRSTPSRIAQDLASLASARGQATFHAWIPTSCSRALAGKTAALARAISVVENARPGFERLLAEVHPHARPGPPHRHHRPARRRQVHPGRAPRRPPIAPRASRSRVIAVDPTSPFTGGALLGDRIRMESVALDQGVYIRSMATRGSLGGLATTTREVCDLLDAAGFDRILVETVGVGQSELDVARMADSTVLVLVPESGDGIQTLKSGVMEIADIFVVNKADRPGADKLRQEIEVTLGYPAGQRVPEHAGASRIRRSGHGRQDADGAALSERGRAQPSPTRPTARAWDQPVLLTIAAKGEGVDGAGRRPRPAPRLARRQRRAGRRRRRRLLERTREVVERATRRWVWEETRAEQLIAERLDEVVAGRLSPYERGRGGAGRAQTG